MPIRRTLLTTFALAVLALTNAGCTPRRAVGPGPGTVQSQRYEAALHDPYPDGDLGPEVIGGRPRDFQKPLAEPVRSRWLTDSWWQR